MVDIGQHPRGTELFFTGNLNADLDPPDGKEHDKTITSKMEMEGFEYMADHFLPHHCHWTRDFRTWRMLCNGQKLRYCMDYILGIDLRLFKNVASCNPRHNSDHYLFLRCIHGANLRYHQCYLGTCMRIPLLPTRNPSFKENLFFVPLEVGP